MKQVLLAVLAGSLIAAPACAEDAMGHGGMEMGSRVQTDNGEAKEAGTGLSPGEVRKVDKDAQKITLRHGPLPELGMPSPMTMVYRVQDPALLEGVEAGDKVRFRIEKIHDNLIVTHLERGN